MAQFLAMITTFDSGARPDNTLPVPPPGWDTFPKPMPRPPGVPTQPIYNPAYPDQGLPQPPLGTWGGVAPPYPDQGLPGGQPYPDQGLPGHQPYPDQGLPGGQGGRPSQPIYFPPEITGPNDPRPTPPIALPPDLPEEIPEGPIKWKVGWTPQTGWVVVGIPQFPMPTPSR
jgi:hypothetical protein